QPSFRSVSSVSAAPRSASAPPVKGVLVPTPNTRNPKINKNRKNGNFLAILNKINILDHT
ncbi:hypothetical protein PXK30_02410, partial [Phaeobacter gallaeciensis]|uniref:hypothetical protein n=1 Tax=Phaeobacter gallaeciensis TaxID=60890 RepID=UPI00237FD3F4